MASLGSSAAESSTSQTALGEEHGAGSNQRRSSAGPDVPDSKLIQTAAGAATASESFKAVKAEAVSQPSQTADRIRVIDQVTQKLDTMRLMNGRQEININLRPDSLGDVKLTIIADKHNVSAHIMTETSAARDAMQNGRDHLREALEQKGYSLQGLDVSMSNSGGESGFAAFRQNAQQPAAQHTTARGGGDVETVALSGIEPRPTERALTASGRLDYEA